MKPLFLIIVGIFFVFNTMAQSKNFNIGLKAEFYAYTIKKSENYNEYSEKFSFSPLPSMYLILSKDLMESFSISLRPGIIFKPSTFDAIELGVSVNNQFPNKIFISGGINLHFNKDAPDGNFEVTHSKTIYFILVGAGYKITEHLSADISFHQPLNGEFGYSYVNSGGTIISRPKKIVNMLKLGIAATL